MEPRNTSLLDQCFSKKKSNLRSSKNNYNSSSNSVGNGVKKEQTFLDFGQKPIAPDPCKQCGMAFQRGRKEDEELHSKYHRSWIRRQSRLLVWNACTESGNDAAKSSDIIIVDCQTCTKRELQRGLEIINVVNDCLGAVKLELSDLTKKQRKLFLHVSLSGNKIDGCVLAEMIAGAHRLVAGDACQPIACLESEISATCGISRIWVAPDARRSGVASRLIDAVRMHFVYGCSVPLDEIAFTQPTADGLALGRRIFGRKDFLVYTES
ncbi:hypothetical protein J3B02_002993 [Coemansia erecta]|nr:hypothetical protein J3B02_002993 [Coemansia erecta]